MSARLRARFPSALLGAMALVCAGVALAQDAETAPPPSEPRCEISGTVTGVILRARSPRRRITLDGVVARIVPVRHGLSEIFASLADGTEVEGTSRGDVLVEVGAQAGLGDGTLVVHPGAEVVDLRPVVGTTSAELDVRLAPGVIARSVVAPCSVLRPRSTLGPAPVTTPSRDGASPRWRARVHDLHFRSGEVARSGEDLRVHVTDPTFVLYERERHRTWVRLAASLPGGDLYGWVADTDLAPAP